MEKRLQWEIFVPIFRNKYILRGLGAAIGIPFGVLIAVILIVSGGDVFGTDAKYALLMILLLLLLTFLFVLIAYGGKYAPGFIVDGTGVVNYTQAGQQKKNRVINGLTIALGLASGNLTAAGAGMMAGAKQTTRLKWKQVRRVRYDPRHRAILLRGGFAEKIAVFCTPENYAEVEAVIRAHLNI